LTAADAVAEEGPLMDPFVTLQRIRDVPGMSSAGMCLNDEKGVPSNETVELLVRAVAKTVRDFMRGVTNAPTPDLRLRYRAPLNEVGVTLRHTLPGKGAEPAKDVDELAVVIAPDLYVSMMDLRAPPHVRQCDCRTGGCPASCINCRGNTLPCSRHCSNAGDSGRVDVVNDDERLVGFMHSLLTSTNLAATVVLRRVPPDAKAAAAAATAVAAAAAAQAAGVLMLPVGQANVDDDADAREDDDGSAVVGAPGAGAAEDDVVVIDGDADLNRAEMVWAPDEDGDVYDPNALQDVNNDDPDDYYDSDEEALDDGGGDAGT